MWSKTLPNGKLFSLDLSHPKILYHKSDIGEYFLSSDSIGHTYSKIKIMRDIVNQFSTQDIKRFYSLASTIGAYIIFPSNMIDNKMTINAARGVNKYIKDRFDLSLLCIKYYYEGKDNPIADVLKRYSFFFDLFNDFNGYVNFFLLNDLIDQKENIKYFLPFKEFEKDPLPKNKSEYLNYMNGLSNFIKSRNLKMRII